MTVRARWPGCWTGSGSYPALTDTTEDAFDQLMNVQFKGVYFLTQKLLPLLANGGRIVNLSTGLTRFTNEGYSAYASMKGAVEMLTRYLAKELGPRRITVNTFAPELVETDFTGGCRPIRRRGSVKGRFADVR